MPAAGDDRQTSYLVLRYMGTPTAEAHAPGGLVRKTPCFRTPSHGSGFFETCFVLEVGALKVFARFCRASRIVVTPALSSWPTARQERPCALNSAARSRSIGAAVVRV